MKDYITSAMAILIMVALILTAIWDNQRQPESKPTPAQHETGVLRVEVSYE